LFALAGLADATYLAVQALTGETLSCGGSPDCFRVLGSSYGKVGGIPVAMLGALAYFTLFSSPHSQRSATLGRRRFVALIAGCDVFDDTLVSLCAGLSAARVLPILLILSGTHISYRGAADRRTALTTPI
jgi:hypothetical protein